MAACSGADPGDGTGGGGGSAPASSGVGAGGEGGEAATYSDVTGSVSFIHATDSGNITNIPDPASVSIAALWPDGAGGFVTRDGIIAADGSFVIPSVPDGTYTLRYAQPPLGVHPAAESPIGAAYDPDAPMTSYFVTSERALDLSSQRRGRPDAVRTEIATPLVLNLDGLAPWQTTPMFEWGSGDELVFANHGGAIWLTSDFFIYWDIQQPAEGATSVSALPLDVLYFIPPHLVQASKGDVLRVTQLVHHEDMATGEEWRAVERAAELSFEQEAGKPLEVSGTLEPLPLTSFTVACDWAAFEPLAAGFDADAELEGVSASVHVNPLIGFGTQLAGRRCPADGTPVTITYGNPYSGGEIARVHAWHAEGSIEVSGPVEDLAGKTLAPALGPPRSVRVNGQPAETYSGILGETPVIEFDPPSLGVASGYVVAIFRRLGPGQDRWLTSVYTADTSVQLPPGIVTGLDELGFEVKALSSWDPAKPLAQPIAGATANTKKMGWYLP